MKAPLSAALALALTVSGPATAQEPVQAVVPVYGQVIRYGLPGIFAPAPAYEVEQDGSYILEHLPPGETVDNWTRMMTVTGARGLGADVADIDTAKLAEWAATQLLQGYQAGCAVDVTAEALDILKLQGARAAFGGYMGCGRVAGTDHSEEMVVVVLVGTKDTYTLQFAERGPAQDQPIKRDASKWMLRISGLSQARLCTPAEGEKAPYPSCN